MNSKERVKISLNRKIPDKIPVFDAPWDSTLSRWQKEGFPNKLNATDYFDFDIVLIWCDTTPQFKMEIIEDDKKYVIGRNRFGELIREDKNHSATIEVLKSPVKDYSGWKKIKERLFISSSRLNTCSNILTCMQSSTISWEETLKQYKKSKEKERFVIFLINTGFDMVQRYMGMEELLITMITEPKWAKEMFDAQAEFSIKVFEYLYDNGLKFDGVFLGNDMGYKNDSLFSSAFYKELIFPSDKLMCDHFHNMDVKVILHSDGNITKLMPDIIGAGFDCIQPIEVKAGMDPVSIRKEYGDKIALWGGIDTRIIGSNNFKDAEKEIVKKFTVLKKEGGYIYQSDHSIPDNIGFLQYKNFLEIVNKYREY